MHLVSLCCLLIFICNYLCLISYSCLYILCCGLSILTGEFVIAFLCIFAVSYEGDKISDRIATRFLI